LAEPCHGRPLGGEPRVIIIELTDRLVPGMGEEIRRYVENALVKARVEVHTQTRVARVAEGRLTLEHNGALTEIETAGIVWVAGVRMNPVIERLEVEKDRRRVSEGGTRARVRVARQAVL